MDKGNEFYRRFLQGDKQALGALVAIYNERLILFFQMNDGTTVGMRLLEGGYVSFRGTSAYVYMPGEIFDVIFNATT